MRAALTRLACRTSTGSITASVACVCALGLLSIAGGVTRAIAAGPPFTFADATAQAGLSFVHENGAAGEFYYPELFGGGVAVLDVDNDRWPDLLFVNGRHWKPGPPRTSHAL